ncbi:MAG: prepilin-type N-terminal cleavage/methylation domain-containing protein [Nitrospirae bacterium]|nr:prepilin-type N-terminal cleavage/methylation domain-containing protein [Nitrospirota bacterium]
MQERGFTLIETVIVVVVIGLAFGILVPFAVSLRNSPSPVLTELGVALAQEKIEQIIADRRDTGIPRGFVYATTPANYQAESSAVVGFDGFTRSVAIACVTTADFKAAGAAPSPSCAVSAGQTDYARVTVSVSHSTFGSLTVEALLANY